MHCRNRIRGIGRRFCTCARLYFCQLLSTDQLFTPEPVTTHLKNYMVLSLPPLRFHRCRWERSYHLSTYGEWNSPCAFHAKSYFNPTIALTSLFTHLLPSNHHNCIGHSEKHSGLTITSRIKKFSTDLNYIQPEIRPLCKLDAPPWMVRERQVTYLFDCPKTVIYPQEAQQRFLELLSQLNNFHFIFTDGSKDDDQTSNAVYCSQDQHLTKND